MANGQGKSMNNPSIIIEKVECWAQVLVGKMWWRPVEVFTKTVIEIIT